ncbi:MAG: PBP1A family penicillin-binding protein [Candidatus Aminicenantes bacterium]|nr:PBP1A family penicillin-binding protein [Candidatus Aminicenantes bacterium]
MKQFFLRHFKVILLGSSFLITSLLGIFLGLILVYQKGFPQIKNLEDIKPVVMTTVYDDQNVAIKDFAIEKRVIVKNSDIPVILKKALVCAEDNQFYTHWGINFRGLVRAVSGVLLRKKQGGGSSITQQLARGLFLTPEFTVSRKLKEMLLAIQIEKKYTKDQILTFYCNKIFLGGSIYGVGAAARHYFGKTVKDINLAEAALIACIIPNPNGLYAIFRRPENTLKRRNYLLLKMLLMHAISQEEYRQALAVKLPEKPSDAGSESLADYFTEDTRKYLENKYGDNLLYKGGLKVFTTLNNETQRWAEEALKEGLRALDKRRGWRSRPRLFNLVESKLDATRYQLPAWENLKPEPNQIVEGVIMEIGRAKVSVRIGAYRGEMAAATAEWTKKNIQRLFKFGDVALFRILTVDAVKKRLELGLEQEPEVDGAILVVDNKSGEIKAMVGGYAFQKSKFNRAIQALRQTGSTFKPIIYTAALEHGFSPATIIQDEPFSYLDEWTGELWEPKNHTEDYRGPLTMRRGLEQSRNVITARILQAITPAVGVEYAKKFGISSDLKPYMSLALGAFEVSLKEMVEAFTVFPNYGVRVNSYFIRSINDLNNNIIEENFPDRKQVIEKETAFIMNYLLQGVVKSGTGWRARDLPAPIGGKTGTANDSTDAWFIGFSPTLTVGVWVGFDQKKSLGKQETGSLAAAPVFVAFMEKYLSKYPESGKFRIPSGVYMINIDKYTGKLLTPDCLYPFSEAFLPGSEPLDFCNDEEHQKIYNYFKTEEESDDD